MSILSRLACDWAIRAFGPAHVGNIPTRSLRIVEEAIEFCQSVGVPKEVVDLCVTKVYNKKPGEPMQEIGGILLTTNIVCAALNNTEPDDLLEMELARVLSLPVEHFRARNQEKVDGGLDISPSTQDNTPPKMNPDGLIEGTAIVPGDGAEIFHNPATGKYFRRLPNGETVEIPPSEVDKIVRRERGLA